MPFDRLRWRQTSDFVSTVGTFDRDMHGTDLPGDPIVDAIHVDFGDVVSIPTRLDWCWDVNYDPYDQPDPTHPEFRVRKWHPLLLGKKSISGYPQVDIRQDVNFDHFSGSLDVLTDYFGERLLTDIEGNHDREIVEPFINRKNYDLQAHTSAGVDFPSTISPTWAPSYLDHIDASSSISPGIALLTSTNPTSDNNATFIGNLMDDAASWTSQFSLGGKLTYEKGVPSILFPNLVKKGANANLLYQFGWKPLMSDLRSVVNLGDKLTKRVRTLTKLAQGPITLLGSVQRGSKSEKWTDVLSYPPIYDLPGLSFKIDYERTTVLDQWGGVVYTPSDEVRNHLLNLTDKQLDWEALQELIFAPDKTPAAIWELIPFSWLADWFYPAQQLIALTSNRMPVTPTDAWMMRTQSTDVAITVSPNDDATASSVLGKISPLSYNYVTKERWQVDVEDLYDIHPGIGILPDLSDFRIGILASLFGQKTKF